MPKALDLLGEYTDATAERQLISILIRHPELLPAADDLPPPDALATHRAHYETTLAAIERDGRAEAPAGFEPIDDCVDVSAETVSRLCDRIRSLAPARGAVSILQKAFTTRPTAEDDSSEFSAWVDRLLSDLTQARADGQTLDRGLQWGSAIMPDLLRTIDERARVRRETGREVIGLRTGLPSLDRPLNGLHKGLYILGGGPGMGKTAIAFQIAENVAHVEGVPVVYVSFENSPQSLVERRLAAEANKSASHLARGYVGADELQAAASALSEKLERVAIVEGRSDLDVDRLGEIVGQVKRRHGSDQCFVVVDYLQLWAKAARRDGGSMSIREKVEVMGAELLQLVNTHRCPVLAMSSLSRGSKGEGVNGYEHPTLASLKESGDLEFAADVVLLLGASKERPSLPDAPTRNLVVSIEKNRHGEQALVDVLFQRDRLRFYEEERRLDPVSNGRAF